MIAVGAGRPIVENSDDSTPDHLVAMLVDGDNPRRPSATVTSHSRQQFSFAILLLLNEQFVIEGISRIEEKHLLRIIRIVDDVCCDCQVTVVGFRQAKSSCSCRPVISPL